MTTPTPANGGSFGEKYNFSWQQVMLRIKDPRVSIPFYEENFGMKLVHFYNFRAARFSVYFLERPRDGAKMPTPGTAEAEEYLWNMKGTCLELTYNHGSESDENFSVNNGNVLPYRGFGHIAFNCDDIEVAALELEKNGVSFYKKPHEGCIKTIAFALDPDGYWIELCNRSKTAGIKEKYNLSQTMLRVKDAEKSLAFYRDILGMKLIMKKVHLDFTIYFLAFLPPGVEPPRDVESEEAREFVKSQWFPFLELTHNHGSEEMEEFEYHSGNQKPFGFGHIGILCDKLEECCKQMHQSGVPFRKLPEEGRMREIAFALDPDGYSIELINRGVKF